MLISGPKIRNFNYGQPSAEDAEEAGFVEGCSLHTEKLSDF
jgi:hypothetical protein